jgi:hypothetical protein
LGGDGSDIGGVKPWGCTAITLVYWTVGKLLESNVIFETLITNLILGVCILLRV